MIELKGLSFRHFRWDGEDVLKNINFNLNEGKAVIVGPNGAGKTSILRACLGLMKITEGSVRINGYDLNTIRNLNLVGTNLPEVYKLLNLDIKDLISLYSTIGKSPIVNYLKNIEAFSLQGILQRKIYSLSTGQNKILCNIMALSSGAHTILLDEPFEGLDQSRKSILIKMLNSFSGEILMNTHELGIVKNLKSWELYFLLDRNLYGPFLTSQIDQLYLTRGRNKDALSEMNLPSGTFSITLGTGDIPMAGMHSIENFINEVVE